jgi:AraC-like DNA-binding protein
VYTLRSPAAKLGQFIEHYWFLGTAAPEAVDLSVNVFVDGRADLIFNFGVPYTREVIGGGCVEIAGSNLDAQRLVPIRIGQRGLVRATGIRFHLAGLAPFARASLHPFTGTTLFPSEILGEAVRNLESALRDAFDEDAQARLLDDFFCAQLETPPAFVSFERAFQLALRLGGRSDLTQLSQAAGASGRQVERLFARFLGIAPRRLGCILRFQTALRALMRDPGGTLAEVAAAAGYFDQAHFIREFRQMTGGVPRGYRGYFPPEGPADFAPNVVAFIQDGAAQAR